MDTFPECNQRIKTYGSYVQDLANIRASRIRRPDRIDSTRETNIAVSQQIDDYLRITEEGMHVPSVDGRLSRQ
jgi:hypothetical protein